MTTEEITEVLRRTESGHTITVTLSPNVQAVDGGRQALTEPLNFMAAILNHEFEDRLPRSLDLLTVTFIGSDRRLVFNSSVGAWFDQDFSRVIAVEAEGYLARYERINSVLAQVQVDQALEVDLAPERLYLEGTLGYKPRSPFQGAVAKKLYDEENPQILVGVFFVQGINHLVYRADPLWVDRQGVEVIGVRIM